MISVNQSLFDRGVRHAVFLERLKAGEVRQILALLNESWPDLLAQLTRRLERMFYSLAEFEITDPDGHVICLSEALDEMDDLPTPEEQSR